PEEAPRCNRKIRNLVRSVYLHHLWEKCERRKHTHDIHELVEEAFESVRAWVGLKLRQKSLPKMEMMLAVHKSSLAITFTAIHRYFTYLSVLIAAWTPFSKWIYSSL